ncbi:MAG: DEAD/DEAH box helicase, partial [Thaumarchaeota archaeon]|nr:DEAD/DEAH box helicase [Nitrososphaerota archaeon]
MKISKLDLEPKVIDFLTSEGYKELFEPQEQSVKAGLFDDKKNFLITIPTASGKTLIAMLAILSHLSKHKTKVIYLTPLRALTSEKFEEFKKLEKLNLGRKLKIALSTGDSKEKKDKLEDADVIFLTNESMDANMAFQQDWIYDIGLVVSDEIHLIGDDTRGP